MLNNMYYMTKILPLIQINDGSPECYSQFDYVSFFGYM